MRKVREELVQDRQQEPKLEEESQSRTGIINL